MIGTIMRLGWVNLTRDRAALFLTFIVPLVFFSIFAMIFGNLGGGGGDGDGGPQALEVLAVDEDGTEISASFVAALAQQEGLEISLERPSAAEDGAAAAQRWTRETAFSDVRRGNAAAAVVVPRGFAEEFGNFGQAGVGVELIYDASNPFALYAVNGLLQAAAFQSSPGVLMERGLETLEEFGGGGMTDEQRTAIANVQGLIALGDAQPGGGGAAGGLVAVQATAAHAADEGDDESPSMVAYYAAGIGVMFLLFSSVGAAGTLLEDQESGTLERLLSSRIGMTELLRARWLFYSVLGVMQIILMFLWGAVAFGLDLFTAKRLVGFGLMAAVTGAAAAAFALLLAAACKSRAQLGGVSTIVILVMSALGGSMVPRFVMPDFMDTLAKFTFNGWALDGFLKVFWYDDPAAGIAGSVIDLLPQLGVLAALTAVFLWIARRLARRWETA